MGRATPEEERDTQAWLWVGCEGGGLHAQDGSITRQEPTEKEGGREEETHEGAGRLVRL